MAVNTPHVVVIIHGGAVAISALPDQSLISVSEGVATVTSVAAGGSKVISPHEIAVVTRDGIQIK